MTNEEIMQHLNNRQMLAWLGVESIVELQDDKNYAVGGLHLKQWFKCYASLNEKLEVARGALSDMVTPNIPVIGDKFPLNRKIEQCKKALAIIDGKEG